MAGSQKEAGDRPSPIRITRSAAKNADSVASDVRTKLRQKGARSSRRLNSTNVVVDEPSDTQAPDVSDDIRKKKDIEKKSKRQAGKTGNEITRAEGVNDKENMPPVQLARAERKSGRERNSGAPEKVDSSFDNPVQLKDTSACDDLKKDIVSPAPEVGDNTEKANPQLAEEISSVIWPDVEIIDGKEAGRKRKWSRPTRVVKLEENRTSYDDEEGSDADIGGNNGEDSDGDYGVRKRQSHGGIETKRAKAETTGGGSKRGREPELSEYERLRLENIRRNQEMLQFLELPSVASEMQIAMIKGKSIVTKPATGDQTDPTPAPVRIKRQYTKKTPKELQPVRTSSRIRGVAVIAVEIGENDMLDTGSQQQVSVGSGKTILKAERSNEGDDEEDDEDPGNLMSGDLYFDKETRDKAIRVDGHYKGWLNAEVMVKYGFEKSAEEAWEANGGGTFSFSDPSGSGSGGASRSKPTRRPKHDAKMVAKAMFKKNPNSFFYRHNEPGQEQWTGDWTEAERELFLEVTREHGCGDKWGLFASHIPHRVGYQCSNYYRQVILPEGLVFDPNYEYTSRGKPIYCGKYNQRRN
ncbi:hypothetical protein BGX28_003089 [Mortierella sp. GBA30]|nr:hypothetical protein BGX28_003089 [Mortierella sp. GBA30]